MNNTNTTYRRKNYFIDKEFQAKFILKFCSLVVIAGILTIGIVYLLASQATTVSIVNSRVVVRSTADFILPVLAQTVAVVVVFAGLATILLTLLFTHRMAGPIFRFRKVLETLEQGDFSKGFNIRNFDQLQALADALNRVIGNNKDHLRASKEALNTLEEKVNSLLVGATDEQKSRIADIKASLTAAQKQLDYFRTS
ncbi:MAG: methyl-accepting chemotaxis protein [Candidatus Omnitrophota bacterium]